MAVVLGKLNIMSRLAFFLNSVVWFLIHILDTLDLNSNEDILSSCFCLLKQLMVFLNMIADLMAEFFRYINFVNMCLCKYL